MNSAWFKISAVILALWSGYAIADCDFDDFPVMDEMNIQIVMEGDIYNNREMNVRSFIAPASTQEVADYYHRIWKDRYSDSVFAVWNQITTMESSCLLTVQLTGNGSGGTRGRLIMTPPPTASIQQEIGAGVIAPADAIIVSDLQSQDGNKQGRVTMITAGESVDETARFYMGEMQRLDWSLQQRFSEQNAIMLAFRKGLKASNILIIPAGNETQVLINSVDIQ